MLNSLDSFLKRTEPGIEAITGEERDIGSFMKLMYQSYSYVSLNFLSGLNLK